MLRRWMPLESDPDIMNSLLRDLGVRGPWGVTEIISLDPDSADFVPKPCLAIIVLLPSAVTKKYIINPALQLDADEQYFIKQVIKNACGTVALIHAVANNVNCLDISPDSVLGKFLESTHQLSPEDRGLKLMEDIEIANLHKAAALKGQSNLPGGAIDEVDLHFITIINHRNRVVELDGYKSEPVAHAVTDDANFVKDAFIVVQNYINVDPNDQRYCVFSLGPVNRSSVTS